MKHICPCDGEHEGFFWLFIFGVFAGSLLTAIMIASNSTPDTDLNPVCESQFGEGSNFVDVVNGSMICSQPPPQPAPEIVETRLNGTFVMNKVRP